MAACCLAYFGFLRVSKFTTPSDTQYDKDCNLSIDDISIDSRDNPQLLKVTLKQSKTDPFWVGIDLYLGATGATVCPVRGLLPYLPLRGHHKGPLCILEDGKYLTRQCLFTLLDYKATYSLSMLACITQACTQTTIHYYLSPTLLGYPQSTQSSNHFTNLHSTSGGSNT